MSDLQQAIKDSRDHWAENLFKLEKCKDHYQITESDSSHSFRVGSFVISGDAKDCSLCNYFSTPSETDCQSCPLGACDYYSGTTLWGSFIEAGRRNDLPAMIRAARALYEKLDSLVEAGVLV